MNTLISVAQLSVLMGGKDAVIVFDCRYSLTDAAAGRKAYAASHIPGAYYADMSRDLSAPHIPGKTGRHPLPTKADWVSKLQDWGLHPGIQVALYDDNGGASAARMWWMLQWVGHRNAAVLDGGWQSWIGSSHPVTSELPPQRPRSNADYSTQYSPAILLTADEIDATNQLLIDARDPARFRGEVEPIDPVAGHIPGAMNSPYSGNLNAAGAFRPAEELRRKFASANAFDRIPVCYCGSGVTACHNILAMTAAGLPMPALYAGSWSEWITNPKRPVAKGS